MNELHEIFAVDGQIPDYPDCEDQCYDEVSIPPPNPQDLIRTKEQGNRGNPTASAPLGNANRQLQYRYKTPFGEGIANGKKELIELGFPPSIGARKHDHYIGGTSYRNQKWKGYEFKTLNKVWQ